MRGFRSARRVDIVRRAPPAVTASGVPNFASIADAALGNLVAAGEFAVLSITHKEAKMDKEHLKGAADKAKGAVKDAAGKLTGDKQMQAEGKIDKAKGAAHEALGDAKDAVRRAQES